MMRFFLFFIFLSLFTDLAFSQDIAGEPFGQDRVLVSGGVVLTGIIDGVEDMTLLLSTDYAGVLKIQLNRVERVELTPDRQTDIPPELLLPPTGPELAQVENAPQKAKKAEVQAEEAGKWKLEAGLNLSGQSGNTDRFNSRVSLRAELERQYDRSNLYGRYAYNTNNGKIKADEVIVGGRYTNFFFKKTGIFFREELETDPFESLDLRSTSSAGFSYKFKQAPEIRLEGRVGLSYRYENYVDEGEASFPGMEYGFDVYWKFVDWASFKGSYTYVPSVRRLDSFIVQGDTGLDLPLKKSDMWKLRFGIFSQYNSDPGNNQENVDMKYYAELIASWR